MMHQQAPTPPPRGKLKWAAVDLDGTLAQGIWTPEDPTSLIGPPIVENVEKVQRMFDSGWKVHIHTARPWHDYERIEAWLTYWQVPFNGIHCGKLLAAVYIDDRAVHADEEDWTGGRVVPI